MVLNVLTLAVGGVLEKPEIFYFVPSSAIEVFPTCTTAHHQGATACFFRALGGALGRSVELCECLDVAVAKN